MSEQVKRFAFWGLILVIGLAGWAGCATFRQTADDEERPPIVIYEASIHFANGYGWVNASTDQKKWRPNQPNGKPAKSYDVTVTAGDGSTACSMNGKKISLTYDGRDFTLDLKPHGGGQGEQKDEPELTSPEGLTVDKSGMILSLATAGRISAITIDTTRCNIDNKSDLRITAKPKDR